MKINCNIIRDLLPLYADQVCSDESRELIDEHLAECRGCSALLQQICNTDIETDLKMEAEDVLHHQADFFKRKSAVIGTAIAGIFTIPVLVCLIVNLAVGAALDWFFIVLASLIVAASLIVVPLVMPENKFLWTLGTFTASLLLLFGVICIYAHGSWFFVVSSSVLFGFSVCIFPFALYTKPLRILIGNQKGLTVMISSTVFFGLMMLSIGLYAKSSDFWRIAPVISLPVLALIWLLFLFIRYAKIDALVKAGICTSVIGICTFIGDSLINTWLGNHKPLPVFRPFNWRIDTVDGNIKWLVLISFSIAGIILIVSSIIKKIKEK